jgi:hypothetical protein
MEHRARPRTVAVRILLLIFVTAPRTSLGWGQLKDIDAAPRDRSHLFSIVLFHHEINFCVAIADGDRANYSDASIEAQTRMALSLWLTPVRSIAGEVAIRRLTCRDDNLNLMIDIGPDRENPHVMGHAGFISDRSSDGERVRNYEVVKLNAHYIPASDGAPYSLNDFETLTRKVQGGRWSLQKMMNKISVDTPMTIGEFSMWAHLPYGAVYSSTYSLLIHELGHSFGLCDTYENSPQSGPPNCSREHASTLSAETQPFSVMQSWRLFYLTPDDRDGIVNLFDRFADPLAAIYP